MTLQEAIQNATEEKLDFLRIGVNAHFSGIEFVKANSINFPVKKAYDYATKVSEKFGVTIEEIDTELEKVSK